MTEDGIAYKCKKCNKEYDDMDEATTCYRSHQTKQNITLYLNSDKESNLSECGLDDDAEEQFMYALYEVAFDLCVNPDGSYEILEVRDGDQILRPIKKKEELKSPNDQALTEAFDNVFG